MEDLGLDYGGKTREQEARASAAMLGRAIVLALLATLALFGFGLRAWGSDELLRLGVEPTREGPGLWYAWEIVADESSGVQEIHSPGPATSVAQPAKTLRVRVAECAGEVCDEWSPWTWWWVSPDGSLCLPQQSTIELDPRGGFRRR